METKPPVSGDSQPEPLRPLDIPVPKAIGRYQLGRRIGSGTCGVVYLALDKALRREVAIKLSPVGDLEPATGKVPGAQRAYETELVAAGRLEHRNIVTVYDAGQVDDLNYLVMEVVRGRTLKAYGKGRERLPASRVLSIIIDCCHALDYSHGKGILHRDIKPANIMVTRDGAVKLLDFGIAIGLSGEGALARRGPTLGTPNYMSPEQILGRELSPASDFYSLTTILYELLTGRQLFKARTVKDLFRAVIKKPAENLNSVRPDLPEALAAAVSLCLEKRPSNRFQTGADFARELAPYVAALHQLESRWPLAPVALEQIRSRPGFVGLSAAQVHRLLDGLVRLEYKRGDHIDIDAVAAEAVSVILEGAVRMPGLDGEIRVLGIGDVLDTGTASQSVRQAGSRCVALTTVTLHVLDRASIESLPTDLREHCKGQFLDTDALQRLQHSGAEVIVL